MKILNFVKKYFILLVIVLLILTSLAFQVPEDNNWSTVIEWAIGILLMLLGAPLTQFLKINLNIKDKMALLLTAVVATVIAIAELMLTNALQWSSFSLENFPLAFSAVLSVATIYYQIFKGSDSVLGTRLLLPKNGPDHDVPG
jgi:hypothetical protein